MNQLAKIEASLVCLSVYEFDVKTQEFEGKS